MKLWHFFYYVATTAWVGGGAFLRPHCLHSTPASPSLSKLLFSSLVVFFVSLHPSCKCLPTAGLCWNVKCSKNHPICFTSSSQKGVGGADIWGKFPNNPVFFLAVQNSSLVVHCCYYISLLPGWWNIVQGGNPLYAAGNNKYDCGGQIWPNWVQFLAKNTWLMYLVREQYYFGSKK